MNNKWKWISIGTVGSLFALSHIGMIGMIARQSKFPQLNMPVGEYTSYSVRAGKDGYAINYRANDPLIMHVERDVKTKGGFLGLGNNTVKTKEQYTVGSKTHHGGPVSNHNTWIDPSAQGKGLSAKTIECIKARGSGEGTGRMVGGAVGASVASTGVASIPFVGWVLAGAATMIGMDQGADIGGSMAESYAGCTEIDQNGEETS